MGKQKYIALSGEGNDASKWKETKILMSNPEEADIKKQVEKQHALLNSGYKSSRS